MFYPEMSKYYGLLSGPTFSISYAVAGIFMGMLISKYNRKTLLTGACIIWSLSSIVSGTTSNFAVLFAMRFILGAFVSVTEPVGFSMIGDYFPRSLRTTAASVLGAGTYLGSAASATHLFATKAFGWRGAYLHAGIFGTVIGLIGLLTMKDPKQGIQDEVDRELSGAVVEASPEDDDEEDELKDMNIM